MARLPSSFNESEHEEMGSFDLLPHGTEVCVKIVESDYKENSKKNGHFVSLVREVVSGEYKGRKIFRNLNIDNPSKEAVEIAGKELTTTMRACGIFGELEETEELHGIEHMLKLGIKKKAGDDPDEQTILKMWEMEGVEKPAKPGASETKSSDKKEAPKKKKRPIFED